MDLPVHLKKYDLDGRVAIITGGAGLLGKGYCRTLAAAGANVIIADIEGEAARELADLLTKDTGVQAQGIQTDVSNPESVANMIQGILDRF